MKFSATLFSIVIGLIVSQTVQADHHLQPIDLPGTWNVEASTDNGTRKLTWTFSEKDGNVLGVSLDSEEGNERNFDSVVVKEKKVTLDIKIEADGNTGTIRAEAEEKSPGKLVGKWSILDDDGAEYAAGELTATKEVSFAGEWMTVAETPNGETESTLTLTGNNSGLKGELEGELGKVQIDKVKLANDGLRLKFEFEAEGNPLEVTIKAKPEGNDKLVGNWIATGDDGSVVAEGKWSAKRKLALVGTWKVVASVPENADHHETITLAAKNGEYSGMSKGDDSEAKELTSVNVDGQSVTFTVPFEYQGNTGTITVEAKLQNDGSLKGEWVLTDSGDTEYARETWKATKR